jgi:hypothetical protein
MIYIVCLIKYTTDRPRRTTGCHMHTAVRKLVSAKLEHGEGFNILQVEMLRHKASQVELQIDHFEGGFNFKHISILPLFNKISIVFEREEGNSIAEGDQRAVLEGLFVHLEHILF